VLEQALAEAKAPPDAAGDHARHNSFDYLDEEDDDMNDFHH
jgi:hypothetical protein